MFHELLPLISSGISVLVVITMEFIHSKLMGLSGGWR